MFTIGTHEIYTMVVVRTQLVLKLPHHIQNGAIYRHGVDNFVTEFFAIYAKKLNSSAIYKITRTDP